ncbi:hypothetical protein O3M35_010971 [Rhynocoris fuscipes]|uniref:Uncharacterized protein n=1 Tax=Rhynocoris fuscipes TaxID=488301 RepID=A0AAW1D1Y6_9HEMI
MNVKTRHIEFGVCRFDDSKLSDKVVSEMCGDINEANPINTVLPTSPNPVSPSPTADHTLSNGDAKCCH